MRDGMVYEAGRSTWDRRGRTRHETLEKGKRRGWTRTYIAINSRSCKKRKMVESRSVASDSRAQDVSEGGRVPQGRVRANSASLS